MTKKKTPPKSKPAAKPVKTHAAKPTHEAYVKRVLAALRATPQSSREIAVAVSGDGSAGDYQIAKVRDALKALAVEGKAIHTGAFRTSKYAKPPK